jgi:hypothetical protein
LDAAAYPPSLSRATKHQGRIGPAETEGIRQHGIDVTLPRLVRDEIDRRFHRRVVEIGTIRSRIARIEKIASTAPAAPSRCPTDDLVDDIEILPAALPTRRCTAPSSISSPSGVEVPCALI